MKVPFLSLQDVTAMHGDEIREAARRVIDSGWYLQGKENEAFEQHYAEYIGTKYCIGCANGLDALIWIWRAYIELGVMQPGDEAELAKRLPNLHIVEPMGYLEFNYLVERAKAVVTDSGGITEETTVMGVPCITLRDNTERPETCTVGTNELIGTDPAAIKPALDKLFAGEWKKGAIPELWDGHTAERIIEILAEL